MKKWLKILIVAICLLSATQAWAIDLILPSGDTLVTNTTSPEELNQRLVEFGIFSPQTRITILQNNLDRLKEYRDGGTYVQPDTRESITRDMASLQAAINQSRAAADLNSNTPPDAFSTTNLAGEEQSLDSCDWYDVGCVSLRLIANVMRGLVLLGSGLVIVANQLFNAAINVSVRGFGGADGYAEMEGVKQAWRICRDLVNVSLIFVILYIAIKTILQLGSSTKGLLTKIIIAALLVNFSAFFTGIVIDASNVVANAFYSLAADGQTGWNNAPDISSQLLKAMNSSYNQDFIAWSGSQDSWLSKFGSIITSYFGRLTLMLITGTILFAGAILFFVRTIILILVIVLSPLAFLGFAVGGALSKLSNKWRDALTNQAIFAPVYLLLIFMSVKMASSISSGGSSNGVIGSLIVFVIINGTMLGALVVAKNLGVAGASLAGKFGATATGFGARATAKIAGRGIKTAGKYGLQAVTTNPATTLTNVGNALGRAGVTIKSGLNKAYTTAKTKPISELAKSGGGAVKFAENNIPGARSLTDAFRKPSEALNELIAGVSGVSVLGQTKDQKKEQAEEKEAREAKEFDATKDKLKTAAQKVKDERDGKIPKKTPAEQEVFQKELEEQWSKIKNKDIVKLDKNTLINLAGFISKSQMEILKKNDGIDRDTITKIQAQRGQNITDLQTVLERNIGNSTGVAEVANILSNTSTQLLAEFISELDNKDENYGDIIKTISKNITGEQFGKLDSSSDIKYNRLNEIRKNMAEYRRATGPATVAGGGPGGEGRV